MGDIPYDLDEAAFLDGCGVWKIFGRVIAPLMMPAVATVGIYTFLQCWNELLFATIFVSSGKYCRSVYSSCSDSIRPDGAPSVPR